MRLNVSLGLAILAHGTIHLEPPDGPAGRSTAATNRCAPVGHTLWPACRICCNGITKIWRPASTTAGELHRSWQPASSLPAQRAWTSAWQAVFDPTAKTSVRICSDRHGIASSLFFGLDTRTPQRTRRIPLYQYHPRDAETGLSSLSPPWRTCATPSADALLAGIASTHWARWSSGI